MADPSELCTFCKSPEVVTVAAPDREPMKLCREHAEFALTAPHVSDEALAELKVALERVKLIEDELCGAEYHGRQACSWCQAIAKALDAAEVRARQKRDREWVAELMAGGLEADVPGIARALGVTNG